MKNKIWKSVGVLLVLASLISVLLFLPSLYAVINTITSDVEVSAEYFLNNAIVVVLTIPLLIFTKKFWHKMC